MDIRKLQRAIVDGLEDVKGQHITVFNTEHLSAMFERVIIASGTSNRQTKALAASVRDRVKSRGMQVMSTEGEDNGEWIIVDCGAAVAHIMQPAIRDYYHLEEIWGGKSVRLKVGEVSHKLVKASEPMLAPSRRGAAPGRPSVAPAKPPYLPAAKPAAAKKVVARKAAAKTFVAPKAAKKFAKPTPAGATRKVAAKKAENKSAAYKRVGAKRPTAGKTTVAARRKPAAR